MIMGIESEGVDPVGDDAVDCVIDCARAFVLSMAHEIARRMRAIMSIGS